MTSRSEYRFWIVLALAALLGAGALEAQGRSAPGAPGDSAERWFVLTIGGVPVGSLKESVSAEGGSIRTESAMKLSLNRMGSRTEMATTGIALEGSDGRLIQAEVVMHMAAQAMTVSARVEGGTVILTSNAGGTSFDKPVTPPEPLLGPRGVAALSVARLRAPGDRIAYTVFAPEIGAIAGVTRVLEAVETIEDMGRPVTAMKVTETMEGLPVATTQWLDAEGALIRMTSPGPFGEVGTFRSGRDEALRAEAGGELPKESYGSSLVRTQVRIPSPREIDALTIEITHRRPELGWPDFTAPGQRVLESSRDRLVLSLTRPKPPAPVTIPVAKTAGNAIYLEPNAWVQSEDPKLVATAREIVGDERDLYRAGKKLERWVAENMQFDMGVVLAPSVEVFEKRRGTCTEYATLLTTLARAAGIPSRFVMGYVYVAGIFGGHAWTEVLAGDEWIPLDGAVIGDGPSDAARIAFVWTALEEGIGRLGAGPAMQVYGHIDVRVLDYRVEGQPLRTVGKGETLFTIDGNIYRDDALGVVFEKPEGFSFTELDLVWPETTLVGLEGPGGRKATLRQKSLKYYEAPEAAAMSHLEKAVPGGSPRDGIRIGGRSALVLEATGQAGLALPVGGEIWLLTVEGDDAPETLREIAGGLRLAAGGRAG